MGQGKDSTGCQYVSLLPSPWARTGQIAVEEISDEDVPVFLLFSPNHWDFYFRDA